MSDDDMHHDGVGASNGSHTYPKAAGALKKGDFVCLKDRPCKIQDLSVSKTGKHGHAKVSVVGFDVFTGDKVEDCSPSSHNMDVPTVETKTYSVMYLDESEDSQPCPLTLLSESGETRDDLDIPWEATAARKFIRESLLDIETNSKESEVAVTVMSAMGKEQVMLNSCKLVSIKK